MVDRINLDRLKNINFTPNKNVAKTTAAVTLLLSTVACSSRNTIGEYPCVYIPVLLILGAGLIGVIGAITSGGGGTGGGSTGGGTSGHAPSNY